MIAAPLGTTQFRQPGWLVSVDVFPGCWPLVTAAGGQPWRIEQRCMEGATPAVVREWVESLANAPREEMAA